MPLKKLRVVRHAASIKLFALANDWEKNPDDIKLADKVVKARQEWEKANDDFERARRRAEWTRSRRIISLAAAGRGQQAAKQFKERLYRVQ